jgi:hypothetical protein
MLRVMLHTTNLYLDRENLLLQYLTIPPRLVIGYGALRPKKLSPDSSVIAVLSVNVNYVINIDAERGIRCLRIIHSLLAPIALTTSINQLDIIPITVPLVPRWLLIVIGINLFWTVLLLDPQGF